MRALVLISDRPRPAITGSRVRNACLWPAVARLGVEVRVLGLNQEARRRELAAGGPSGEIELHPMDRQALPRRVLNALLHSYHEWPRSSSLTRRVAELVAEWRPDVVHAEELRMASYFPQPPASPRLVRTLTLHNVEGDLLRQIGASPFGFGHAAVRHIHLRSLRRFERRMLRQTDLALAFSPADLSRWRELHPDVRWGTTRNGTDATGVTPQPQRGEPSLLFVGSLSYAPNVLGLAWFLETVLPTLPRGWIVTVAGSHASVALRKRLEWLAVRFVDTPADLGPLYASHALLVVPLLQGSGTRGKILEALAHERVVVSTSLGAQGLDLGAAEGVILADEPASFAAAIRKWAPEAAGRGPPARRGREAVLRRFDWPVVAQDLVETWNGCLAR